MIRSVIALVLSGPVAAGMSRGTTYCHQDQPLPSDCWVAHGDVVNLPACTASSGASTCKCPKAGEPTYLTERCDVQDGSDVDPTPSYCTSLMVYNSSAGEKTMVCQDMVTVSDFPTRPTDSRRRGAASYENRRRRWHGGSWCDSGYVEGFDDNECLAKERYAGESCWDGWASGECQNGNLDAYDTKRLSCVDLPELESATAEELADTNAAKGTTNAKCVPSVHVYGGPRPQATCAGDWWFLGFTCGAHQCNGHAAVWSTGDGNKRCDWHTTNDW